MLDVAQCFSRLFMLVDRDLVWQLRSQRELSAAGNARNSNRTISADLILIHCHEKWEDTMGRTCEAIVSVNVAELMKDSSGLRVNVCVLMGSSFIFKSNAW